MAGSSANDRPQLFPLSRLSVFQDCSWPVLIGAGSGSQQTWQKDHRSPRRCAIAGFGSSFRCTKPDMAPVGNSGHPRSRSYRCCSVAHPSERSEIRTLDVGSPKAIRLEDCEKMVTKTTCAREARTGGEKAAIITRRSTRGRRFNAIAPADDRGALTRFGCEQARTDRWRVK